MEREAQFVDEKFQELFDHIDDETASYKPKPIYSQEQLAKEAELSQELALCQEECEFKQVFEKKITKIEKKLIDFLNKRYDPTIDRSLVTKAALERYLRIHKWTWHKNASQVQIMFYIDTAHTKTPEAITTTEICCVNIKGENFKILW